MTHGLLLAAGAGTRFGGPKALHRDAEGRSWLAQAVTALLDGGCSDVTVALGASAAPAEALLRSAIPDASRLHVRTVLVADWASGMGASLRAGLDSLRDQHPAPETAMVHLVDLPDVGAPVVRRVLGAVRDRDTALARAAYRGRTGHPVLLGRRHWAGVVEAAAGDEGARAYLAAHETTLVECGDLATGTDVDHRPGPG